jgi:hypothetical protein
MIPDTIAELRSLKQRLRALGPRPPWWRRARRRSWTNQCHEWLADALAAKSAVALHMVAEAAQSGLIAVPGIKD